MSGEEGRKFVSIPFGKNNEYVLLASGKNEGGSAWESFNADTLEVRRKDNGELVKDKTGIELKTSKRANWFDKNVVGQKLNVGINGSFPANLIMESANAKQLIERAENVSVKEGEKNPAATPQEPAAATTKPTETPTTTPTVGTDTKPATAANTTSSGADSGKNDEGVLKENGMGIGGLLLGGLLGSMMGGGFFGALIGALLIGLLGSMMDGDKGLAGKWFGNKTTTPNTPTKIQVVQNGRVELQEAAFALDTNGKLVAIDDIRVTDDNFNKDVLNNSTAIIKGRYLPGEKKFEITHVAAKGKDGFAVGGDNELMMYELSGLRAGNNTPADMKLSLTQDGQITQDDEKLKTAISIANAKATAGTVAGFDLIPMSNNPAPVLELAPGAGMGR